MQDTFKTNRSQFSNLLSVPGQKTKSLSQTSLKDDDTAKSQEDKEKDKEGRYMYIK